MLNSGKFHPQLMLLGAKTPVSPNIVNEPNRKKVFISYSHKDKKWLDELSPHLRALTDQRLIETWDDRSIEVGAQWHEVIDSALKSVKAAILLVSKDFLDSDFIMNNELPVIIRAAQSGELIILPVVVSPCRINHHPELCRLQYVNPPSRTLKHMSMVERDALFVKLTERIDEILAQRVDDQPPIFSALHEALNAQNEACVANNVPLRAFHKLLLLIRIAPDYISSCFAEVSPEFQPNIEQWLRRQVLKQLEIQESRDASQTSIATDLTLQSARVIAREEGATEVDVRHFLIALLLDTNSATVMKIKEGIGAERFDALVQKARSLPFSKKQTMSNVSSFQM